MTAPVVPEAPALTGPDAAHAGAAAAPAGTLRRVVRHLARDPLALLGVVLLTATLLAALFAPWLAPFPDQGAGAADVASANLAPSAAHWFGTDALGRDVLSRVLFGARTAVVVSVLVVAVAAAVGVPIGLVAGYRGGWVDEVLMRITDMVLAFPSLLLAMVIVAFAGPGLTHAAVALALSWWPWYARLARGLAAGLRDRPFVEGARVLGLPTSTVLRRHVLPNAATPVLVQATLDVGTVVLAAGSLAFIGLGAQPPTPDWGLMVAEGRTAVLSSWWISTFPGAAIFVAVLGVNLVGDAVRDLLDPRGVTR